MVVRPDQELEVEMQFVLLALAVALPSQQQEPPPSQEVMIVGRRVPDLADAPVSGTALDSAELERRRVSSLQDLTRTVPGIGAAESGPRPFGDVFSVRGLTNTPFFSNASMAFYVDDIPFGDSGTYVHPLDLAERVEVLRGPQHTLFGRYAYGGAVNVTSRRTGDQLWAAALLDAASHDTYSANVALGVPLVPKTLSVRLGGGWGQSSGFIDNTLLKVDSDDQRRYGGNMALTWTPNERWEIGVTLAADRYDDGAPRLSSLSSPDPYKVSSDVRGQLKLDTDMQALRIAYRGDGFEALAVTARRNWRANPFETDLDFTPTPGNRIRLEQEQVIDSQEIRVRSSDRKSPWEWVGGVYAHLKTTRHDSLRELLIPNSAPPPPVFAESEQTRYKAVETAGAAFGQLGYRSPEGVGVHVGLRYDHVRESMERNKTSALFPPTPPWDQSENFDEVTGRLGADYRINEEMFAYANLALAFKPGGFSGFSDDPAIAQFDKEVAHTVEAGFKSEFAEGRFRIETAAFHSWIDGYQVERFLPNSTNLAVFNAEKAVSYGIEIEASAEPVEPIRLFGSLAWTRAVFIEHGDPATGADYSGNRIPYVPKFSAWLGVEASLSSGFFARVEYLAKGPVAYDEANTPAFREGAYGTGNVSVGWRWNGLQITATCTNFTDEFYHTTIISGIQAGSPGPDRVFGLRVRYDF